MEVTGLELAALLLVATGLRAPGARAANSRRNLSRRADSNCRPAVYETAALPLSYVGADFLVILARPRP